jgi:hypothetical protein
MSADPTPTSELKLLDVVALLDDLPAEGLMRGQVGTVVELFNDGAAEVEFSDDEGRTLNQLALYPKQFVRLLWHSARVA